MNYTEIHRKAVEWMIDRGWRETYGKKGAFTQSLLQHTDVELNVLLELLPILARPEHFGLSKLEQQALIIGQVVHDVGKETEKWQQYVKAPREQQRGNYVPHVIRPLTDEAVVDLVNFLGFSHSVIPDATKFVNLHMAATRNITNVLAATLLHKGNSIRWNSLARIIDEIDNICSIPALLPTLQAIENNQQNGGAVGPHLKLAYHLVSIRGVSTVLLHKAAEKAYRAEGWLPLLYFSEGTIYAADSLLNVNEPNVSAIMACMAEEIQDATPSTGYAKMVVGNPLETFLPKPDFFDYREIRDYLKQATQRISRGSFRKKPVTARRKVIENYYQKLGHSSPISDQQIDVESDYIDTAQPEMLAFKFFKVALDPEMAGKKQGFAIPEQAKELEAAQADSTLPEKERKRITKALKTIHREAEVEWVSEVATKYEAYFGEGSFARLQSTSTIQPAHEMATVIEPFWQLPGKNFGLDDKQIGLERDDVRMNVLIETLTDIANYAYALLPEDARPIRATPTEVATTFVDDLIHPHTVDIKLLAGQQLDAYKISKPKTFKPGNASRICPICNKYFSQGTTATADFLDKPESHTNRAVAHGATGKVTICNACKYERFLQQLLLGEKVARVLVITPRNHIGRTTGAGLLQQMESFRENASIMMSNDTANPNRQVTLALTGVIAGNLFATVGGNESVTKLSKAGFDGGELSSILSYTLGAEKQKEYRKTLRKAILEEYELDNDANITEMNEIWESSYTDWEAALEDIINGHLSNETLDEIRVQTYRLRPQLKVICQTPNLILVPLRYDFAVGEESDTNAALREMFALLLIGLALDCSIAAIDSGEAITFVGGEGVARVPAVPAIRDLIGSDWVSLEHAKVWLEKIGAASLLASATAYPERSNLYEILRAMTPGHILRRIEMKSKSGQASSQDYQWIRIATQAIQQR
jgi:hypothetical protein